MNQQEFYLNQPTNHECFKLPGQDKNYLLKGNFLSEFFGEDEKAEARFNLGITPLLNELRALVYAKLVDEAGNLKFGQEPTNGEENEEAYSEVLSSAVIYNTLLKYYTKEEIDGWIQNIDERVQALGVVDEEIDATSTNPVQNKVIAIILEEINNRLGELNASYTRLSNNKADKEQLLNYNTIDEVSELLSILRQSILEYVNTKAGEIDLTQFYTKEELNILLGQNYATKEFVQQATQNIEQINTLSDRIDSVDNRIDQVEGSIRNLPNYSNEIQNINQSLQEINQAANSAQEIAGSMQETIGSVQGDIVDIQDDIESIQEDIEEAKLAPKHVFLRQSQYEALESYEDNTLYFTFEDSEGSQFGDEFPLTLA